MKEKRKVLMYSPEGGCNLRAKKIGRNELCKCGSGKKAKKCCGCETEYYNNEL